MKVTLIRANMGRLPGGRFHERGAMEPLEVGVVAALTPADVDVRLYDDRVEPIHYDEPTDLVGITIEVYTAQRVYEIAAQYRRRGVPVVLGGFHATLAPEECKAHADAVVIGDAESVWADVIEDARAGRLKPLYRGRPGLPQAVGVMPRRDLFPTKGYLPVTLVQFSRGCPYPCEFCAISTYFERRHVSRPITEVIAEIERAGRRTVFFVDDNVIVNRRALKSLLRALIPLRLRWISQASIDMADDPELMDLMEASGCLGTVTGFESVDPAALMAMGKIPNLRGDCWDRYQRQVEVLRSHHLQTWAAFTLGHDHEDERSIRDTLDFASSNRFAFAAFNILTPYPGTPLYARLAAEGRLLFDGRWWLHPDYRFNDATFRPMRMAPDVLTQAVSDCRRQWTSAGSIFRRMWDFETHLSSPLRLALYLRFNSVFRRDARDKQGMLLGTENGATGDDLGARSPSTSSSAPQAA